MPGPGGRGSHGDPHGGSHGGPHGSFHMPPPPRRPQYFPPRRYYRRGGCLGCLFPLVGGITLIAAFIVMLVSVIF